MESDVVTDLGPTSGIAGVLDATVADPKARVLTISFDSESVGPRTVIRKLHDLGIPAQLHKVRALG